MSVKITSSLTLIARLLIFPSGVYFYFDAKRLQGAIERGQDADS
jgi:hypothetical protein